MMSNAHEIVRLSASALAEKLGQGEISSGVRAMRASSARCSTVSGVISDTRRS